MQRRVIRYVRLALLAVALGSFCKFFKPGVDQRLVDGLWLAAVGLTLSGVLPVVAALLITLRYLRTAYLQSPANQARYNVML